MSQHKLVIISPVRNEGQYIQRTIDSVVAQTLQPTQWIIVDDGSTDHTADIVSQAAQKYDWIHLHRRSDRGQRQVGAGVIEAFYDGLAQISLDDYEYLCKLDGDLQFGSTYFESIIRKFEEDPRLGTASGKCWDPSSTGWTQLRTNDQFSMGACKFYRTVCFNEIGGFVRHTMWDGIDCHRCRMKGWKACSFHDEELRLYELRPMGSSHKSVLHGRMRWGTGQYFMGTHWLYALGIAGYRMFERPYIIGGLCILVGYIWGFLRRIPRYNDSEFRIHLHRWQLTKLGVSR